MVPNILPPVQEVKYSDSASGGNVSTGNAGFNIINGTSLLQIIQGTSPTNRIGRNIRVVGVVLRALVTTEIVTGGTPVAPITMDLVWDTQCNGAVATVGEIYTTPLNGISLPNPLYDNRFKFAKRTQIKSPQNGLNLIDFSYNCNQLVEYKSTGGPTNPVGGAGVIADLSKCNLYLIMATPGDASAAIDYQMRILYVDA